MTELLGLCMYFVAVICFVLNESRASYTRITLDIGHDYCRKATHATVCGASADWNEIMDARYYFLKARR